LGVDLLSVYSELKEGKIDKSTADALANVAGKVINSLKVQLEYNSLKSTIDRVQLLESEPVNLLLKVDDKKTETA
jgi:hypothetical protein